MSLPICIEIPELPDPFSIRLPGGVTMESINLLELLQPAFAPLVPLFEVVDTVVAIFHCIRALPEVIGPPPDPTILAACIPELAEKVNALIRLMPQLSIPYTIISAIDLLIDTLRQVRSQLLHLQQQVVQITGAIDRATVLEDAGLMAITQCAQHNVEREAVNVGKSLASLGKLIGLLNLFLEMIGGPEIPDLSELAGRPLDETIGPLDAMVASLQEVRAAVPVP